MVEPETDVAKILFASFATAYAGGTPKKIKNGVIKNPPPTPNKPERTPTNALNKSISTGLTKTCAIGKKTSIKNLKASSIAYLKVIKVPTKITPQQAAIAEKIPVLIKVVFLLVILLRIFIFEKCILISEYT